MKQPLRLGFVGLGGYASPMLDTLLGGIQRGVFPIELHSVCDPEPFRYPQRMDSLRSAGVTVHLSYQTLLLDDIDAVYLPVPIHLHTPFTLAALAAGKAVLCEKPIAGTLDEIDQLQAAEAKYKKPVLEIGRAHV